MPTPTSSSDVSNAGGPAHCPPDPVRRAARSLVPLLFIVLACITLDCGANSRDINRTAQTPPPQPASASPTAGQSLANLAAAHNQFGLKLFQDLAGKDTTTNVFISPTSIELALSMIYDGSLGTAREAMATTLALQGIDANSLNQADKSLLTSLQGDKQVTLSIADSIWVRKGLALKQPFLRDLNTYYGAKAASLDFSSPHAAGTVNSWVSSHTNGKISIIVTPPLSPSTQLLLVNAIYFHGNWAQPFDSKLTKERAFTDSAGAQELRPMMDQSGEFDYLENDTFQAVSLPYGKDGRFSMVILLPNGNLDDLVRSLNLSTLNGWLAGLSTQRGELVLPKFQLSYQQKLNGALADLGMGAALKSGADFSGITNSPLQLSEVLHKTFVSVDEKGTEAAAATGVGIAGAVANPPPPFSMIVNRPFLVLIRDSSSGELLFIGRVERLP